MSTERELGAINFFDYMLLESMSICSPVHHPEMFYTGSTSVYSLFLQSTGKIIANYNIGIMRFEAVSGLCRKARYKCHSGELEGSKCW